MKVVLKYLGSDKSLAFTDQVLVSGCNFILLIYVGKNLPTTQFGLFSLAMLIIYFLSNFHRAMLTRPMEMLAAKDTTLGMHSRHAVVLLANLGAAPIGIFFLIGAAVFLFNDFGIIFSGSVYLVCSFFQDTMRRYWYCTRNLELALLSDLVSYGGQTILTAIFIANYEISAEKVFLIMAMTSLGAFAIDLITARKKKRVFIGNFPAFSIKDVLMEHWAVSKWICLSIFVIWLSAQVYPIFISFLGPAAVASYSACTIVLRAVNLPVQAVDNYLPLQASRVLNEFGVENLKQHLKATVIRTALVGLILVVLVYLLTPLLMNIIYGGIYDSSATILRLLLPASFFLFLGAVLGCYSYAMLDMRASFFANLAGAIWTFTGGICLVYLYGIYGAAIAASFNAAITAAVQAMMILVRIHAMERMQHQLAA